MSYQCDHCRKKFSNVFRCKKCGKIFCFKCGYHYDEKNRIHAECPYCGNDFQDDDSVEALNDYKMAREEIQEKVDYLMTLNDEKGWREYLHNRAMARKKLYHYTTLTNLKSILKSQEWWIGKTSCSNDPNECEIYCLSFSRGLGTMAMWGIYSRPSGNGVRIRFDLRGKENKDKFKKVFHISDDINNETSRNDGVMYDIAYYHSAENKNNCLEFDGITLWGNSQSWAIDEKQWPCFLKSEIWRNENETRIVYPCKETDPEYLKISLKELDFSQLTFELSPDFLLPSKMRPSEDQKNEIIEKIFGKKLLEELHISVKQFFFTYENASALLKKPGKDLFKPALKQLKLSDEE